MFLQRSKLRKKPRYSHLGFIEVTVLKYIILGMVTTVITHLSLVLLVVLVVVVVVVVVVITDC